VVLSVIPVTPYLSNYNQNTQISLEKLSLLAFVKNVRIHTHTQQTNAQINFLDQDFRLLRQRLSSDVAQGELACSRARQQEFRLTRSHTFRDSSHTEPISARPHSTLICHLTDLYCCFLAELLGHRYLPQAYLTASVV
jgi:hypothetical protein